MCENIMTTVNVRASSMNNVRGRWKGSLCPLYPMHSSKKICCRSDIIVPLRPTRRRVFQILLANTFWNHIFFIVPRPFFVLESNRRHRSDNRVCVRQRKTRSLNKNRILPPIAVEITKIHADPTTPLDPEFPLRAPEPP